MTQSDLVENGQDIALLHLGGERFGVGGGHWTATRGTDGQPDILVRHPKLSYK